MSAGRQSLPGRFAVRHVLYALAVVAEQTAQDALRHDLSGETAGSGLMASCELQHDGYALR